MRSPHGRYGGRVVADSSPIKVVPANQATWADIEAVVGTARSWDTLCFCQRFKLGVPGWRATTVDERADLLREQTDCGYPRSDTTAGLLAYVGGEPAGWCRVEPRPALPFIPEQRTWCKKRGQDLSDDRVWVVACFVTRTPFRYMGVSRTLAKAAVDFARARGAGAVEGYAMVTQPGVEITWGELHVGSRSIFAAAGLRQVAAPTKRRVVMRIDL
jgi:GNAT superfamily N-acetyltransferase